MKYGVRMQYMSEDGTHMIYDMLNNNDTGFTREDAENIARQLRQNDVKGVQVFEYKPINTRLSLKGCWAMVNAIQNADTPQGIRERCGIAEEWLKANEVIDSDQYDELMMTVAYLHRESYHMA